MKKTLTGLWGRIAFIGLLGLSLATARAQGTVMFVNRLPGVLDAPVFDVDGSRLAGAGLVAQLYAGPTAGALQPTGPVAPFRTGAGAGYWNPGAEATRVIPSVAPGSTAMVQVRIWERAGGETYAAAEANGAQVGASPIFTVITGGAGEPATPPAFLTGLASFGFATLGKLPPRILVWSGPVALFTGQSLKLIVEAEGSGLGYQWRLNDALIPGETRPEFIRELAKATDAGKYTVVVRGANGMASEASAIARIEEFRLTEQPVDVVGYAGKAVTFKVNWTAVEATRVRWLHDGQPIPGANTQTLSLPTVTLAEAGEYVAEVSGATVTERTRTARLTVGPPPAIGLVIQPTGAQLAAGERVTLQVRASSEAPLRYQWFRNGAPVPGATKSTLLVDSLVAGAAGDYSVVVRHDFGVEVRSQVARVEVTSIVITVQPASQAGLFSGEVTLSVDYRGNLGPDASFAWRRNGLALTFDSQTFPNLKSLRILGLEPQHAGDYDVVLRTGPPGSPGVYAVTSAVARLTLSAPAKPVFTRQPVSQTAYLSGDFEFSAAFQSPVPASFQWYQNGTTPLYSYGSTTLTRDKLTAANLGDYTLVVSNYSGMTTSAVARLTLVAPPAPKLSGPVSTGLWPGGAATLRVQVDSPTPYEVRWFFNATNELEGATSTAIALTGFEPSRVGDYFAVVSNYSGVVTSQVARVTLADSPPPVIAQQPPDKVVVGGSDLLFFVTGIFSIPVTSVQWRFNGVPLPGATNSDLRLSSIRTNQAGGYDVILGNTGGSVTSRLARVTVLRPSPPVFFEPLASRYVAAGSEVLLASAADSRALASYQWFFAGQALANGTNESLILKSIPFSAAGEYFVVVSNDGGAATSQVARLTVLAGAKPSIVNQPQGVRTRAGEEVALSVNVSGSPPLAFQWRLAGTNLPGATGQRLVLPYAHGFQAGDYTVVVENGSGSVTSQVAKVEFVGTTASRSNADVDGDGHGDLIFQHKDGSIGFWHMEGLRLKSVSLLSHKLPSTNWRIAGMAQIKRDGHPDLLLESNDARPVLAVWNLDGTNLLRGVQMKAARDPNLRVVSFRDMDGDGSPDVLQQFFFPGSTFYHGRISWLKLDGVAPVAPSERVVEPTNVTDWRAIGAGDLNGDGALEVVLQKKAGALGAWFMTNGVYTQGVYLTPAQVDAEWVVKAIVDLNGDGKDDLVFQHTRGTLAVWFMEGTRLGTAAYLEPAYAGDGWELVGPK